MWDYKSAEEYIDNIVRFTKKKSSESMKLILEHFGDPQKSFSYIHVAGTNGKGSVCAYLDSMLREAGRKTGLFTSPHLVTTTERMKVNGDMISQQEFTEIFVLLYDYVKEMEKLPRSKIIHPTYFEWLYIMAMIWFGRQNIEYGVIETGLGGRLDATNIIENPAVTVITSISYDHTAILGDTLPEIASEKAGIIKQGVPLICDGSCPEALAVLKDTAAAKAAPIITVYPEDSYPGKSCPADSGSEDSYPGKSCPSDSGSEDSYPEDSSQKYSYPADSCTEDLCPENLEEGLNKKGGESFALVKKLLNKSKIIDFCLEEMYHDRRDTCKNIYHIELNTPARYQAMNSSLAFMAFKQLKARDERLACVSDEKLLSGLYKTHWPGRLDQISPGIIVDGAHNVGGALSLKDSLDHLQEEKDIYLVFAVASDKEHARMVSILSGIKRLRAVIVTQIEGSRKTDIGTVADEFRKYLPDDISIFREEEMKNALLKGKNLAGDGGLLICTGSLYLTGSIMKLQLI